MTFPIDLPLALNTLLPADFSQRISVNDAASATSALPDWAASLMWLGAWCRSNQQVGKRLIVFAVLPTRNLAAAFAGLGSLVAGAREFKDELSWPIFSALPCGSCVFWRDSNGVRCSGEIVGVTEYKGAEFVAVKVIKARKKSDVGTCRKFGRSQFDTYQFSEEKPPSPLQANAFSEALHSIKLLIGDIHPKWLSVDGAEALIVSNVTSFETAVENLSISVDGAKPVNLRILLCLDRNNTQRHAKLRIEPPRGDMKGTFPLAILDGPSAFWAHEHLGAVNNMLVILDRSEYQDGIHDKVLELQLIPQAVGVADLAAIPDKFAHGFELAGFWIDSQ